MRLVIIESPFAPREEDIERMSAGTMTSSREQAYKILVNRNRTALQPVLSMCFTASAHFVRRMTTQAWASFLVVADNLVTSHYGWWHKRSVKFCQMERRKSN